jgi:hypothetical protein
MRVAISGSPNLRELALIERADEIECVALRLGHRLAAGIADVENRIALAAKARARVHGRQEAAGSRGTIRRSIRCRCS